MEKRGYVEPGYTPPADDKETGGDKEAAAGCPLEDDLARRAGRRVEKKTEDKDVEPEG